MRNPRYPDSSTYGIVNIGGVRYRGDSAIYTPGAVLQNDNIFYQDDEYVIPTASSSKFDV